MSEMYDSEEMMGDYWSQEPMQHDQFMQGMEQHQDDEQLKNTLRAIYKSCVREKYGVRMSEFQHLCGALKIDIRDVT